MTLGDLNGPSWSPEKKIKKINNFTRPSKSSVLSKEQESDTIKQASKDSVRAIMFIRAYRIRAFNS